MMLRVKIVIGSLLLCLSGVIALLVMTEQRRQALPAAHVSEPAASMPEVTQAASAAHLPIPAQQLSKQLQAKPPMALDKLQQRLAEIDRTIATLEAQWPEAAPTTPRPADTTPASHSLSERIDQIRAHVSP